MRIRCVEIEIDFPLLIPVKVDAAANDPMGITYDDDSRATDFNEA